MKAVIRRSEDTGTVEYRNLSEGDWFTYSDGDLNVKTDEGTALYLSDSGEATLRRMNGDAEVTPVQVTITY